LVLDEPEIRALENGQLVQRSYAFALPFSETDIVPVLSKARFPFLPDEWEVSFVAAPVLDYDVVVRISSSTDSPDIVRRLRPTDEELGFLEMLDRCWQSQDVFRDQVESLGLGNREFVRGQAGDWSVRDYDRAASPFLYTFERAVW
jgi:hypothetical protein